jgi:hypothetical protein
MTPADTSDHDSSLWVTDNAGQTWTDLGLNTELGGLNLDFLTPQIGSGHTRARSSSRLLDPSCSRRRTVAGPGRRSRPQLFSPERYRQPRQEPLPAAGRYHISHATAIECIPKRGVRPGALGVRRSGDRADHARGFLYNDSARAIGIPHSNSLPVCSSTGANCRATRLPASATNTVSVACDRDGRRGGVLQLAVATR